MHYLQSKTVNGEQDNIDNIMESHLNKIKISISLTVLCSILFMIVGITYFKDTRFFLREIVDRNYAFAKNKLAYSFSGSGGGESSSHFLANTMSLFAEDNDGEQVSTNTSSIPVLLYHGIVDEADRFNIEESLFKDQMFALKRAGYHTITIEDLIAFNKGEKELDNKAFLLTFDDGRTDSYKKADPILRVLDFNAVMYVAVKSSIRDDGKNSTYYIDEGQIKDMVKSGRWEIGSHGLQETGGYVLVNSENQKGTFLSNKRWIFEENRLESDVEYKNRLDRELGDSKTELEKITGKEVLSFSYPFGDYGQQAVNNDAAEEYINDVLSENYSIAFKQVWSNDDDFSFNKINSDPYFLKRIEVQTDMTPENLLASLKKSQDKSLPFEDSFAANSGWINNWGDSSVDGSLVLKASDNSSGGLVFLDGTANLKNYLYSVDFDWTAGSHVSLISRYRDGSNYTACTFSDNRVIIQQYTNNIQNKIIDVENFIRISTTSPVSLSMLVDGDFVKCLVGDKTLAYATIPEGDSGGVGMKVWDENIGVANIVVNKINLVNSDNASDYIASLPQYENKPLKVIAKNPTKPNPNVGDESKDIEDIEIIKEVEENDVVIPEPEPVKPVLALPYEPQNVLDSEWTNVFGDFSKKDGALFFGTNASTTSSHSILVGSESWSNYIFNVQATWFSGSSMTLVARHANSNNYVACSFGEYGLSARLYQVVDGVSKTIARSPRLPRPALEPWKDNKFAIAVNDNEVYCIKDSEWVVKGNLKNLPATGGVGIKTYDVTRGHGLVSVNYFSIK